MFANLAKGQDEIQTIPVSVETVHRTGDDVNNNQTAEALRKLAESFARQADRVYLGDDRGYTIRTALLNCADEALKRAHHYASPRAGHSLKVEIEEDQLVLTPVCHEPDGALCRESSESSNTCLAVFCLLEWDTVAAACSSSKTFSVYDGMPIRILYSGEDITWEPVED